MASSPQKNLQFISPPKEAGDFLQNQVKFEAIFYKLHTTNYKAKGTVHEGKSLRATVPSLVSF